MKKVLVLLVAVVALGFASNAQNAIGVRFGGGHGYGAELSYQMGMNSNRLELDLGLGLLENEKNFNLVGIYQWHFNIVDNFGWYVGPGLNLGYCSNHGLNLSVAGQIGVDYAFKSAPFQVSLDVRPSYMLIKPDHCGWTDEPFNWQNVCLGVRYTF